MRSCLCRRLVVPVLIVAGASLVTACGGEDAALSESPSAAADATTSSTAVASVSSPQTPAPASPGAENPAAEPLPLAPADGVSFVDPQGKYTISVSPGWESKPGAILDPKEVWFVADPLNGFRSNMNILDESVPPIDLDTLLDASIEQLETEFDVVDDWIALGTHGNELGFIEYTGSLEGGGQTINAHFLAVVSLNETQAVYATFASEASMFEELYPIMESYMMTLQAS